MMRNDLSVSSQNNDAKWPICEQQSNKETNKIDLSVSSQNNEENWPIRKQSKQQREMTYLWAVKATKKNDPSVSSQSNK